MTNNPVPDGHYRIRKAGAKSQVSKSIWNGKKCHYVQIGMELTGFATLEEAVEFVKGKGLEADRMSLDFGVKPAEPVEDADEVDADSDADDAADESDDDGEEATVADSDDSTATA